MTRRHRHRIGGTTRRLIVVVLLVACTPVAAQEPPRASEPVWRPIQREPERPVVRANAAPADDPPPPVLRLPDLPAIPQPPPPVVPVAECAPAALTRGGYGLLAFAREVHDCLTYPDPCYEPRFVPAASAAFFVESFRPVTQTRIGYDGVRDFRQPDRAEYFWARADGSGKGPTPVAARPVPSLKYDRLLITTEAAAGNASVSVTTPYQSVDPLFGRYASGFGDITIGAKSLLFECELLQIGMLFNTTVPAGNFRKGLGAGHVSLEPSLLLGLKLSDDTYVQAQVSQWIPLGGDPDYQGALLHTHTAVNHVLARIAADAPIVGSLEVNTFSFQAGAFTDPLLSSRPASGRTFVSLGPGLRAYVTERFDVGFGAAFAATGFAFPQQTYRFEVRFRF